MANFRLPDSQKRTTVAGSTGSGKTQFSVGLLSTRDYNERPWIINDPKGDELIASIGAIELPRGSKPPTVPGLYVMHPRFGDPEDMAWQERFFEQVWAQEYTGLYIDEGYMVPRNSKSFLALLTQGRSKRIEMIMCTQRPVMCHPMMFSESDFLCAFRLNKPRDRETVNEYMNVDVRNRLPEYSSYWYDVGKNTTFTLGPAPSRDEIITSFRTRLKQGTKVI